MKELEAFMKRTEDILEKLEGVEKGEAQFFPDLIEKFREFVVQTSEQDKLRRQKDIERQEQKVKEIETQIFNKRKLEKLLTNLNGGLKLDGLWPQKSLHEKGKTCKKTSPNRKTETKF